MKKTLETFIEKQPGMFRNRKPRLANNDHMKSILARIPINNIKVKKNTPKKVTKKNSFRAPDESEELEPIDMKKTIPPPRVTVHDNEDDMTKIRKYGSLLDDKLIQLRDILAKDKK